MDDSNHRVDQPATDPKRIVAGLRSENAEDRQRAMDALFPGEHALLIREREQSVSSCSTSRLDLGRMFSAVVAVGQQIGAGMGIQLNWVGTRNPKKPGIEVVCEGVLR